MKNNFSELLQGLDQEELDLLLEDVQIDPPAGTEGIRDRMLARMDLPAKRVRRFDWRRIAAIAACLALLVCITCAVEAQEYNDAIRFFQDCGLSTEGLTRGEIKAVYRDITTESFSYSKTAEVLAHSISSETVSGFVISQDEPTPEEIESLWDLYWLGRSNEKSGIRYVYDTEFKADGLQLEKSTLSKYDGETLLWSASVTLYDIRGYVEVSGGVIAYGETLTQSSGQPTRAWITKIDDSGNILWNKMLLNGFEDEYIAAVLENSDGSYAVFSRGDLQYFCLTQFSRDGQELSSKTTDTGGYGIWNAARFGDGYLVQLGSYLENEYAKIVKMDREGNITDTFSYSAGDADYYLVDMIEFDGNIYLSAYAVPKLRAEEPTYGGRSEIARILDYVFNQNEWEVPSEELTPVVRENYSAILLVCDAGGGAPMEFYSVQGSLGGSLSVSSSGELIWNVHSIASTFYSPSTSSFTIGGTCAVFRYTFGENGALLLQEKTDETAVFRR